MDVSNFLSREGTERPKKFFFFPANLFYLKSILSILWVDFFPEMAKVVWRVISIAEKEKARPKIINRSFSGRFPIEQKSHLICLSQS